MRCRTFYVPHAHDETERCSVRLVRNRHDGVVLRFRWPWLVILACYIPTLLSIAVLPFWPLYVDTGVNAVYARKTPISNRINSGTLLHEVLPSIPSNVSGVPFEPAVQALVGDGTAGSSDSSTVFGAQVIPPPFTLSRCRNSLLRPLKGCVLHR